MRLLVLSAAVLAVVSCAEQRPPRHGFGPPGGGPGRGFGERGGLFVSPMGEPFRGEGGREALITRWFNGADANQDGKLSLAEFRADAQRFFRTLDTNHDGEIDPDELAHYESDILPEARSGDGGGSARPGGGGGRGPGGGGGMGGHRGGGMGGGMGGGGMGGGFGGGGGGMGGHRGGGGGFSGGGGGGGGAIGAARFDLLGIPEPVASADTDLNRGVTAEEFRAAADKRFMLLDVDHDGAIRRDELPSRGPSSRP